MKNNLMLFSALGVAAAAALGGGYLLSQSNSQAQTAAATPTQANLTVAASTPASLPKPSGTWQQSYALLQGKADLASLVTTYKQANDCLMYHNAQQELEMLAGDERLDEINRVADATVSMMHAQMEGFTRTAEHLAEFCGTTDRKAVATAAMDALFSAAMLGDVVSQACYVEMGPVPMRSGLPETQKAALQTRYIEYAPAFRHAALSKNDPLPAFSAMVAYTNTQTDPHAEAGLSKADPYLLWKSARLAELRSTPAARESFTRVMDSFRELNLLNPAQIADADAKARQTYEAEFAGQASINPLSQGKCFNTPELYPS